MFLPPCSHQQDLRKSNNLNERAKKCYFDQIINHFTLPMATSSLLF